MSKSIFSVALCVLLLALSFLADAQQPGKVPRIAYLSAASASSQVTQLEAFRQGLRKLGYSEGKISSLRSDMQRENEIG